MKKEIDPQESNRAEAFSMWMSSPQPMVTLVKTFDVTHLVKVSKKSGVKFNVLMCWCIGRAAKDIKEFYLLPERLWVGDGTSGMQGKLFQFDRLAINVIVENRKGWFKITLPISFQFHHVQMDGGHAARFLAKLEKEIKQI